MKLPIKFNDEIIIRELTMKDAKALMDYINPMTEEPGIGILMNKKISLKEEKKYLKDVLEQVKKGKAIKLAAVDGDRIVSVASIELMKYKKSHVGGFGIAVSKDYRGKGLGKFMMKTIIDYAVEKLKGLKLIELDVFADNKWARHLYEKMGFKKTGIKPKAVKQGNKYIDEIMMYKDVD